MDGGLSLTVITQELTPDDALVLLRLKGKLGYMVFKETKVEEKDVADLPDTVKAFDDKKTPSQRLRSRMFVYFKDKHKTDKGFNAWYTDSLNEIGQKYLDKLQ